MFEMTYHVIIPSVCLLLFVCLFVPCLNLYVWCILVCCPAHWPRAGDMESLALETFDTFSGEGRSRRATFFDAVRPYTPPRSMQIRYICVRYIASGDLTELHRDVLAEISCLTKLKIKLSQKSHIGIRTRLN